MKRYWRSSREEKVLLILLHLPSGRIITGTMNIHTQAKIIQKAKRKFSPYFPQHLCTPAGQSHFPEHLRELGIQGTPASTPVCSQCLLCPGQDLACSLVKPLKLTSGLWVSWPWISTGNSMTAGCRVPLECAGLRPIPFQSFNFGVITSHCCKCPLLPCQVHLALTTLKDYTGTKSGSEIAGWNIMTGTATLVSRYLPHISKMGPLQHPAQDGAHTPWCTC